MLQCRPLHRGAFVSAPPLLLSRLSQRNVAQISFGGQDATRSLRFSRFLYSRRWDLVSHSRLCLLIDQTNGMSESRCSLAFLGESVWSLLAAWVLGGF